MVPGFRRDDTEFLIQVRANLPVRIQPAPPDAFATGRHAPYTDGAAYRPVARPARKGILMPQGRSRMEETSVADQWSDDRTSPKI